MDAAENERLQLIYDNIVGLATAGVVSVLPSAEELCEGLSHLSLSLATEQELSACLWVLEAALGSGNASFPTFESFLSMAGAEADEKESIDLTPPPSDISMVSSDGQKKHGELRLQLEGLLSQGAPSPKSAKSFFSSEEEEDSAATVSEPQGGATGASVEISDMKEVSDVESEASLDLLMPNVDQLFLSSLIQEALQHLKHLRDEVKSKNGVKIIDFLEELLERTSEKAEELEDTLAAALQSARQCREAVKKSWKHCKTVLGRFGKAEVERRKWQEKWQAQCAELEDLRKEAKVSNQLKDISQAQTAAFCERTCRLGLRGGPVAIAFAWFRVAAIMAPLRRKHVAHLEKAAAWSSLERLRRRMNGAPSTESEVHVEDVS